MKKFLSFLLPCLLLLSLASCGGSGLSDEEIADTFRALVEASYPLNDIYYGDGLPYEEDEEVMRRLTGVSSSAQNFRVSYMPVSSDAVYQKEEAIRNATKQIFSEEMCTLLFTIGFEGMSSELDERVSYARYIEKEGILTVRIDLADDALPLGRTYDFDSIKIITDEESRIKASFPSYVDGEPSISVSLTIIKTPDGWRLDSPTY